MKIALAVERLADGSWESYKITGTKTADNNYTVAKVKQLTVPGIV